MAVVCHYRACCVAICHHGSGAYLAFAWSQSSLEKTYLPLNVKLKTSFLPKVFQLQINFHSTSMKYTSDKIQYISQKFQHHNLKFQFSKSKEYPFWSNLFKYVSQGKPRSHINYLILTLSDSITQKIKVWSKTLWPRLSNQ